MGSDLDIKWAVEAEDRASRALESIDENLLKFIDTQEKHLALMKDINKAEQGSFATRKQADKALSTSVKKQSSFIQKLGSVKDAILQVTHFIENIVSIIAQLDFKQFARIVFLLSIFAKLKGFDRIASLLKEIAIRLAKFGVIAAGLSKVSGGIGEIVDEMLSMRGILRILGLDKFLGFVGSLAADLGSLVFAIAGVAIITPVFAAVTAGILATDKALLGLNVGLQGGFIEGSKTAKGFAALGRSMQALPRPIKSATEGLLRFTSRGLIGSANKLEVLRKSLLNFKNAIIGATNFVRSLPGVFSKAIRSTELFDKGLVGIISRVGVAGIGFATLGRFLLTTDSTLAKMSGVTLIGLALAFGGVIVVVRQFLSLIGGAIQKVGTFFVKASQKAAATMVEAEAATFAFNRTITNFNHEFGESVGTLDSWNKTIKEMRAATSVSTRELRLMATETVEVGARLGFTEEQMKNVLKISIDYAKANKRTVLDSLNAVIGGLTGQGQSAKTMGIFLDQATVAQNNFGKGGKRTLAGISETNRAQLRYNTLLSQYTPIAGIAAAASETYSERQKSLKAAFTDLNAEIGKGAEIIENQVNRPLELLVGVLQDLSKPMLKTIGFFQALGGRFLQFSGIALKLIFTITFLVSAFKALNVVLASSAAKTAFSASLPFINKSIIGIIRSVGVMNVELTTLGGVARTVFRSIGVSLVGMTRAMLGLNAATKLTVGSFVVGMGKQAVAGMKALTIGIGRASLAMIRLAFNPVVLTIAAIAASLFVLFKALQLVNRETGIFTQVWNDLKQLWEDSSPLIDFIKEGLRDLANIMKTSLLIATRIVAIAVLQVIINLHILRIVAEEVGNSITNFVVGGFELLISAAKAVGSSIKDFVVSRFNSIKGAVSPAIEAISSFGTRVASAFRKLRKQIAVVDFIAKIFETMGVIIDWVLGKFKSLGKIAGGVLVSLGVIGKDALAGIKSAIAGITSSESLLSRIARKTKALREQQGRFFDEIILLAQGQDVLSASTDKQTEALKRQLEISQQFVETLKARRDIEDRLAAGREAQFQLAIGDIGARAGLGQRQSETIFGGITEGGVAGANKVAGVAAKALGKAIGGPVVGEAFGKALDFFGRDTEEFKKMIDGFFDQLIDLPDQLAQNLPVFIEKLVKAIPLVITALTNAIPTLIDKISEILGDPTFWESATAALAQSMLLIMGNPLFWLRITGAMIRALVMGVPRMIDAMIAGFNTKFGEIFGNFSEVMKDVGKIFKDAVQIFKDVVDILKKAIDKIGGGIGGVLKGIGGFLGGAAKAVSGGVGGFVSSVAGAFGFAYGGLVKDMQRAQNGLIVGGNSFSGDRTLIRANAGEMMLNRGQQGNLLDLINTGGTGESREIHVHAHFGKQEVAEFLFEIKEDGLLAKVLA